ncbi:MAG: c-type cytochrome [Chloroflexi bacterium]|nr:c-type cytochrome [Chloroflexota bacterium]
MKLNLLISATSFAVLLLIVLAVTALAEGEPPPPPYAGMKNPFPWDTTSVQDAGKKLYQQSCLGCHGAKGSNLPTADFSKADYQKKLEESADYVFWVLSEGRMDKGMPGYKSSLSEENRWQVLTYMWALGKQAPPKEAPATKPIATVSGKLQLVAPQEGKSGETLPLSATLRDDQGNPVENARIRFFVKSNFFAQGLMEIGAATTDDKGIATFEYVPRHASTLEVVARYDSVESTTSVNMVEGVKHFYQPEVGLKLPSVGKDIVIGPPSAKELNHLGEAPTSALRLPGGILSWLLLPALVIVVIWATYFRVMYQVFCIPTGTRTGGINLRFVPFVALALIIAVGALLALKIVTGPYSHFHLVP